MNARERLAQPRASKSRIDAWFEAHPEARAFVATWEEMVAQGTTDWGVRHVARELKAEHGFPFHFTTLYDWTQR